MLVLQDFVGWVHFLYGFSCSRNWDPTRVGSDVFPFYSEGAQMVRIEFLTVAAKSIGGRGSNP